MLQKIRWFFLLVAVIVIALLMWANSSAVTVNIPFITTLQLPLSILLITTSLLSFVVGSLVTGWMLRRRHQAAGKPSASSKASTAGDRSRASGGASS